MMSIALSVRLKPSLLLGGALLTLFLAVGWVGWLVCTNYVREWFALPVLIVLAALAGVAGWQVKPVFRPCVIAISPDAQITLMQGNSDLRHVHLLAGSTLWPNCMLLRFQDATTGWRYSVPVLPDSVGRIEFRALLVACRWLEARHGVLDREKNL